MATTTTSNRDLSALIGQVLERVDEMNRKIEAMLPREIYEVRHGQMVAETQELTQRLSIAEKAISELNSQVATTRLAASQQITSSTQDVRQQISDTRSEITNKIYDLVKNGLFLIAGAVLTYIAYHH